MRNELLPNKGLFLILRCITKGLTQTVIQLKTNSSNSDIASSSKNIYVVDENGEGQRVDNYLLKILKGVPKSRVYKAIRNGEVRVNSGRVKASHKLHGGDKLRIPPIRMSAEKEIVIPPKLLESIPILYEDEDLIIVDKPAGLAVHSGTENSFGVIEGYRQLRTDLKFIELVHRIDRETSGCLMMAKNRNALLHLQAQLNDTERMGKSYMALVKGNLNARNRVVDLPIARGMSDRKMIIDAEGKKAKSIVSTVSQYPDSTLIEVKLYSGRKHQVRVHCAEIGYPLAGDSIYGDWSFNQSMKKVGLGRLFLHAHKLHLTHPITSKNIAVESKLPRQLLNVIDCLSI